MPKTETVLADGVRIRPLAPGDTSSLLDAYVRNRAYLLPFEPDRDEEFYTLDGQARRLSDQLSAQEAGALSGWVLLDGERVVGTVTLSHIVRGPLSSANLGYWIDQEYGGRGLASAAAEFACAYAEEGLRLHRVEAGTLLDNLGSQRVLAKCGFSVIGDAAQFLHIAGAWRDHRLFQRILHDGPPR